MNTVDVFLDLETTSQVDLNRAGTDAYARDCRVVVGAIAVGDGPVSNFTTEDELVKVLRDAGPLRLVAHSAGFEHAVLRHCMPQACARVPRGGWRCTMVAARSLNLPGGLEDAHRTLFPDLPGKTEEGKREVRRHTGDLFTSEEDRLRILSDRCKDDVEKTRRVWKAIGPMLCPLDRALMPIDLLINARGVPVDTMLCESMGACVEQRRREMEVEVCQRGWGDALAGSPGYRLASERKVKALAAELPQEDIPFLFQLAHTDGQLAAAGHKWAAGTEFTAPDGRARHTLVARFTQSGRWVGKKLQLQNMKRPTGSSPHLDTRRMLAAPDGHSVVAADFRQLELRVGLWMARADDQVAALAEGRDLYAELAERALGRKPDADERFAAKTVLLGILYGSGKASTFDRLKSEGAKDETCEAVWAELERDILPRLRAAWKHLMARLKENTGAHASHQVFKDATWLRLPLYDRPLLWHSVRWGKEHGGDVADTTYETWDKGGWTRERLWGGRAFAHVVSGTAADIMAAVLVKAEAEFEGTPTEVFAHCHDEIICLTQAGTEEEVGGRLREWMRAAGKEVPLEASVGWGKTWADAK